MLRYTIIFCVQYLVEGGVTEGVEVFEVLEEVLPHLICE